MTAKELREKKIEQYGIEVPEGSKVAEINQLIEDFEIANPDKVLVEEKNERAMKTFEIKVPFMDAVTRKTYAVGDEWESDDPARIEAVRKAGVID